jgi:urea transport system permease protein
MTFGNAQHRADAGLRRPVLFSVLLLMGLGLAIIFGQMGVINMAHGEFMTIGAYTIYLCLHADRALCAAAGSGYYFLVPSPSFIVAFALGWLVEWALIRHLYKRPLDTLLATWGLSLGCSRCSARPSAPRKSARACPTG